MSLLLPDGIDHLADLPSTIFDALRNALMFLGFDELEKEYRPPRKIWMEPDLMVDHFKWVEADRRRKYSGDKSDIADVPIEGPVSRNALTKHLRGRE